MSRTQSQSTSAAAEQYARQAERLSLSSSEVSNRRDSSQNGHAVEAKFITPLDPVIQTEDGNRLPAVPLEEAHKINDLKDRADGRKPRDKPPLPRGMSRFDRISGGADALRPGASEKSQEMMADNLGDAIPPSRTHPLFPPLPLYGPPSLLRNVQCMAFRVSSAFLSTGFLLVIVLGAIFTSILPALTYVWLWMTFRDPDERRPFIEEERQRAAIRRDEERQWKDTQKQGRPTDQLYDEIGGTGPYTPLEGGPDPLICSARYYARRVGLDMEEFRVQTEDGFIITLWHVYDPCEYNKAPPVKRNASSPNVFKSDGSGDQSSSASSGSHKKHSTVESQYRDGSRRYPVLLMHGLLQSAGAYCVNDESSLAFYLHRSGYDVWLGNNRCGFHPEHSLLQYSDPRMWAWNIRQMGVMDLPALISRVLEETGFSRLGLIAHSQGTTETFVALAKEQRPDLGEKINIFCALAPAVYAGPLIGKMYFKFMRVISPAMFRVFFGIHSFIPLMMFMHKYLPGKMYGVMGYMVFKFMFGWTDTRWDRGLRDRLFIFSPVYVSSESMRWWLGRECFAKQRCILSTKEAAQLEDQEDEHEGDSSDDNDTPVRTKEHCSGKVKSKGDASISDAGPGSSHQNKEKRDKSEINNKDEGNNTATVDVGSTETNSDNSDNNPALDRSQRVEQLEIQNAITDNQYEQQSSTHDTGTPPNSRSRSRSQASRSSWYPESAPPMALWVCGSDALVDGHRLIRRFHRGREPHVNLVHAKIIPEYEHLDVLWAMDAIEQVGREVRECVWRCMNDEERKKCRKIVGVGVAVEDGGVKLSSDR